jgi:hypothetical protein
MAKVLVQTIGGVPKTLENVSNPADAARQLEMSLDNVTISVNSKKADASVSLRDDDFLSFTTNKVTSGC